MSPKNLDREIKTVHHDLRSSLFVLKSKFLAVHASLICYGANALFFFNPEFKCKVRITESENLKGLEVTLEIL